MAGAQFERLGRFFIGRFLNGRFFIGRFLNRPYAAIIIGLMLISIGCNTPEDVAPPSPALSAEEALATIQVKPGYRVELVAAEPMVEDPVAISFDEDGRLWVVEMRGFMPDIDGNGENDRIGRIAVLFDDDGDGKMDRRTTFLDSLILPRSIAIVKGGALVAEKKPLWFVEDTDGDFVADRKTMVDSLYGGRGLPEHSPNGLWRGIDNWYYNAKSRVRYRRAGDSWIQDSTEFRGQWGLSHDDKGRLFYNYNWSQLHADLVPPNYLHRNPNHKPTSGLDVGLTVNRSIYPIRPNPAVNRGYVPGSLDDEGKLLEFTSASAPFVYRGTAMPDMYGNVFVCEPAGNLIKRNVIQEDAFSLISEFAYPNSEFIASTDERFRPVNLASGPDGALYVVDMYRGLIQHGAYVTPYLREQTLARDLVLPIHMGRIWRVVPDDWTRRTPAPFSDLSTQALVMKLYHFDGWHRDTAQRLLVERNDPAALPLLHDVAQTSPEPKSRLHALWTLEGLGETNPAIYFKALEDRDPTVQATAIRILEKLARNNRGVQNQLQRWLLDTGTEVQPELALQIALTAGNLDKSVTLPILINLTAGFVDIAVMRDAILSSLEGYEYPLLALMWDSDAWKEEKDEKAIFLEMLTSAILNENNPNRIEGLMVQLNESLPAKDWRANAMLTALSLHAQQRSLPPVQLSAPPAIFAQAGALETPVIAELQTVATMFAWPGHRARRDTSSTNFLADPANQTLFADGRQHYLSGCAGCHGTDGTGLDRFGPPLAQSEWVQGNEEHLVRLVLHGIEGPIEVNGRIYDAPDILPVMPGHSVLDDREIASILTYIRLAWGNQAAPIGPRTVGRIRHGSQGRVVPWTPEELLALEFDDNIN